MTWHKRQPKREVGSIAVSYLILFAIIGVIMLPTLVSLWPA